MFVRFVTGQDQAEWKQALVHPDHHLIFERGFYSVPTRYVGETVWVRGTCRKVEIYDRDGVLVWTWEPATTNQRWRTDWNHYPPGKRAFLIQHPQYCRARASQLGESVLALVGRLLESHSYAHLRKVQAILRLGEKFGPDRLDQACARAMAYEDLEYRTVKNILVAGLERDIRAPASTAEDSTTDPAMYLRSADSFVHELKTAAGGAR